MTDARRKQVADALRKVASLLNTRKAPARRFEKRAACTVDLRALKLLAKMR